MARVVDAEHIRQLRLGESLTDLLGKLRRMRGSERTTPGRHSSEHFLDRMLRGLESFPCPILLAMSGRDLTAREFEDFCIRSAAWTELLDRPGLLRVDYPSADHTLSDDASLRQLGDSVVAWLGRL